MATAFEERPEFRYRALVVDDSRIARYMLSGSLTQLGFDVEVADSAELALKQLAGRLPDIVFMDHLLPGIDGLEAVSLLRSRPRTAGLPIVMYTSQDGEDFAARARTAGADDVYSKTADESVLGDILQRLKLMPVRAERPAAAKVVPLPRGVPAPRTPATITRTELLRLLEPSLEAHHVKLHQELLGEFAILERYEERMRRDLFARVDALTRHAADRVDQAFAERRMERRAQERRGTVRWWAMAAGVALVFGLGLATSWKAQQRNEQIGVETAATLAELKAGIQALGELGTSLLGAMPVTPQHYHPPTELSAAADPGPTSLADPQEGRNAAAALVTELQSMGILGPVRIETSAGSFCVSSTSSGFQIEASNLTLRDCEALPVRLSAANL